MYWTALGGCNAPAACGRASRAPAGCHKLPFSRGVTAPAAAAAGSRSRGLGRWLDVLVLAVGTSGHNNTLMISTTATRTRVPVKPAHHLRQVVALPRRRTGVRVAASPPDRSERVAITATDSGGGGDGSAGKPGCALHGGGGGAGGSEGSLGGHIASSVVGAAAGTAAVLAALGRGAVAALGYFSGGVAVAAGALGGALAGDLLLGRARAEDVETDADVERSAEEAAEMVIQKLRAAKARSSGSLRQAYRARRLLLRAPHPPAAVEERPRD